MHSEIGVTPYAKYYMPYLDGVELKHCRMADEELGCAEVYVLDEKGRRTLETRMVFGKIELRPAYTLDPWNNPQDKWNIDQERLALARECGDSEYRGIP